MVLNTFYSEVPNRKLFSIHFPCRVTENIAQDFIVLQIVMVLIYLISLEPKKRPDMNYLSE